jgi:hypothetical protein
VRNQLALEISKLIITNMLVLIIFDNISTSNNRKIVSPADGAESGQKSAPRVVGLD